ncbi:MAG: hypothetical protein KJP23_01985 [Deltaproteobacteria bacterium]|nr:hypothetical protein [Deltaproteobacteria bacterium]
MFKKASERISGRCITKASILNIEQYSQRFQNYFTNFSDIVRTLSRPVRIRAGFQRQLFPVGGKHYRNENRGQMAEDRGQKTDAGRQRAKD